MPFFCQKKGENDRRKYFMINLHKRMLPISAGSHLGYLIGTILAFLDLEVTLMLPTKPFGSGEEVKIDFQDGCHLGFLIEIILAIFDLQVTRCFPLSFKTIGL